MIVTLPLTDGMPLMARHESGVPARDIRLGMLADMRRLMALCAP